LLASVPKVDPFEVPEKFFESFPHQVQAELAAQKKPVLQGSLRMWGLRLGALGAVAAVIAFLLMRGPGTPSGQNMAAATESQLDPALVEIIDADESDLLACMETGDFSNEVGSGFTADEIAAYIEHDDLPLDLLIEEL
jgi:hypothetical protein